MALFSSTQPSLRARILPRFPAQVLAGNRMAISKNGGVYVFSVIEPAGNIPLTGLSPIQSDRLVGRDTAGAGSPEELTVGGGIGFTGAGGLQLQPNQRIRFISPAPFTGAPVTTGIKADLFVPFSCVISQWTLLGDQVGSIVVDIWKVPYASYPPVVGNSITGSALPTISSAVKGQSNVLTGWTTAITAGDVLRFNVNSVSTFTRVGLFLDATTV